MEIDNINHIDCSCYECSLEDSKKLSYYLNSSLVALKPVKIWSAAGVKKGGKVINIIPIGGNVGKIYSWVKDANGAIWLQLVDNSATDVSKARIIGYTPFFTGYFDKGIAVETSSGKAIERRQAETSGLNLSIPEFTLPLYVKLALGGVIILVLIVLFIKLKK